MFHVKVHLNNDLKVNFNLRLLGFGFLVISTLDHVFFKTMLNELRAPTHVWVDMKGEKGVSLFHSDSIGMFPMIPS